MTHAPTWQLSKTPSDRHNQRNFWYDLGVILERLIATLALIGLSPLLLLIAFIIKSEDQGPVFFLQTRLGRHRQPFRVIKFRTMQHQHISRCGHWLRQSGLDELPQLVNIALGQMRFVGPRPLTQADTTRLGWSGPKHRPRWSVCPGITGLAQLYSGRGKRVSWFFDHRYVNQRSLKLDISILLASALVALLGKKRAKRLIQGKHR